MSDLDNQPTSDLPPAGSVWPPRPGGEPKPSLQGAGSGDIREFQTENDLIFFLLLVITLGLYGGFWLIRTTKVIDRLNTGRTVAIGQVYALLGLQIVNLILSYGILIFHSSLPPAILAATTIISVFSWVVTIFYWVTIFQIRAALNEILEQTSPTLKKFSVLGTFFFGALYLQIRLNQRIRERQAEVLQAQ